MAGNIEDYITVQAESLPTGSISFGRFELESLSWERRSSFSHNRYLEEVEKYSTPGSVTQKKAYFEAHFKRKALEREASSASQNEIDWQTTANGTEDHVNYIEEYLDRGDGRQCQFAWNEVKAAISNDQEHDVLESNGGELQFSWYDETPPAMSDEDEYEVIENDEGQLQLDHYDGTRTVSNEYRQGVLESELEANSTLPECLIETIPCNDEKEFDYVIELLNHDEVLQSQFTCNAVPLDKDGSCIAVEQMMEKGSLKEGKLLNNYDVTCKKSMVEKDNVHISKKPQKASLNVKATVEQKSIKAKLQSSLSKEQTTRKDSTEESALSSAKQFTRSLKKMGRGTTSRTKSEKHSLQNASPITMSTSKDSKTKDQENPKAQARQETRSGKDQGGKKGIVGPHSISGNGETILRPSASRAKKNVHSSKTEIKQSSITFNFKSDARAEKRKEFFMKLEEKLHAKEAEMNEIQAKTQVKSEAEMKQFRRSLNFKATPMPSFYEAFPRDSDGKKTVVTQDLSLKLRSKSSSRSGSSIAHQVKSQAISKAANKESSSSNKPVSSTSIECSTASEGSTSDPITASIPDKRDESKDISQVSQSAKKVVACKKKEREKPLVRGARGKSDVGGSSLAVHVAS